MGILLIGLMMFLFFGFMTITTGGDPTTGKLTMIGFCIMIFGMFLTLLCL